ncbi:MAG: type II toxin-antitoxin system HicA family toxin [Chloroflexi bacterium]|nr:type II toxin-antitoxin system HicA family toxin [Chloroflexota bacterium]
MKLPRDLSGRRLAVLLQRYGYQEFRQTGSHLRLVSTMQGTEHHVTIPLHDSLKVGTLNSVLGDVADYLGVDKEELAEQLF